MLRQWILIVLAWAVLATSTVAAQKPGTSDDEKTPTASQPASSKKKISVAEQIVELEETIAETASEIEMLRASLDDPESEFAKAKAAFLKLDQEHDDLQEQIAGHREQGDSAAAEKLEAEWDSKRERWQYAKDRLDTAITKRGTQHEQLGILQSKLEQDRALREKLQGPKTPTSKPAEPPPAPPVGPTPAPSPGGPPPAAAAPGAKTPVTPPSEEVLKAEQAAAERELEAAEAEQKVQTTEDRLATLDKILDAERRLLEAAEQQAKLAQAQEGQRREQLNTLLKEHASLEQIAEMNTSVNNAMARMREAQREVNLRGKKVEHLFIEYNELQEQRIADLEEAAEKRQRAADAVRELERVKNPFSRENLLRWFNRHAARVLFILVSVVVLILLVRVARRYIIKVMVGGDEHGTEEERYDRAQTLVYVFQKVAYFVIIVSGLLMILTEVGINMVPLLGGAAALSVAIGFGAQSLVKDYFSGFMILLENQYGINDVVKIGGVAGMVERVGLRVTVLRDLEGTLHFIPNGQANVVSNLTHGWSRVVLDVRVGYREDVQRVMDTLAKIGSEIRGEPQFGAKMIGEPEILGVDALGDSAITIKVLVKTRPMQQWTIKREFLRRIKTQFDALGIEIPFPHRTIYHREGDRVPGLPADRVDDEVPSG